MDWKDFWKSESRSFHKIMKMSTAFFAERLKENFIIQNATLLDYGCGPGFLVEHFEKGNEIVGVDINENFIHECKSKFPRQVFHSIQADEAFPPFLIDNRQKFDFIILLSVSQYYPNKEVFGSLLKQLSGLLNNEGKIIVADVLTNRTSALKDLLAVSKRSLVSGNFINLVIFVLYLLFSSYRKVSKEKPLLLFSDVDFENWALTSRLNYEKTNRLTLHPTRTTYILKS